MTKRYKISAVTEEKNTNPQTQTVAEWIRDYEGVEKVGLKVKETGGGGDFKKVSEGTHMAVNNMIVDLGLQNTTYMGEAKVKPQVYFRFEVPGERVEYEIDGQKHEGPMSIGKTYTASLAEKANLRKDLQGWRNKTFTPEELEGFDIENVVGKCCQIVVGHREANGKVYANITSIAGWPKGLPLVAAENEVIYYDADNTQHYDKLPKWLKEKLSEQVEDVAITPPVPEDDFDDSIPF